MLDDATAHRRSNGDAGAKRSVLMGRRSLSAEAAARFRMSCSSGFRRPRSRS